VYPERFDYVAPVTLADAVAAAAAPGAAILAGGQSLLPDLKQRLRRAPTLLVDIGRLAELDAITASGDAVTVGAGARHAATAASPAVRRQAAALAEAAAVVADPQVRNRGTTCGALAHADASSDECCAALALGGVALVQGPGGGREVPVAELFPAPGRTALVPGEILVALRVPAAGPGEGSAYDKLGTRGGRSGWSVAGAAAWVRVDATGVVTSAAVAVSGAVTRPRLAPSVAEALTGTDGSPAAVAAAAALVHRDIDPPDGLRGPPAYRAQVAEVYAARAVHAALSGGRA